MAMTGCNNQAVRMVELTFCGRNVYMSVFQYFEFDWLCGIKICDGKK